MMRALYPDAGLRRAGAGRAVRMMGRMLSANGVTRARDLPEEARVRLYRQLSTYLKREDEAAWERRVGATPIRRLRLWMADARELLFQALLS
jgi:hypothetical protein